MTEISTHRLSRVHLSLAYVHADTPGCKKGYARHRSSKDENLGAAYENWGEVDHPSITIN